MSPPRNGPERWRHRAAADSTGGTRRALTFEPLAFQPVVAGQRSGVVEESQVTIRSEDEWLELKDAIGAPTPLDPIDFENEMVVVVFGGLHQSRFGQEWWTMILEAPVDLGALATATWVEMRRNQPVSPRFGGPQEETPYIVVVVEGHSGPIAWTKEHQTVF